MPARRHCPHCASRARRRLNFALGAAAAAPLWLAAWPAAAEPLPPLPRYTQPVLADSPLVGRILLPGQRLTAPSGLLADCAHATLCLLGEQHDHPDHHALQAWILTALAQRGRLAALALEMADAGRRFAGPPDADDAAVRAALAWDDAGWPWRLYAGAVMAAVRAGVPVVGVNLPRADTRAAAQQPQWDDSVPPAARRRIVQDVIDSHCGLLPAAAAPQLARVQFARDARMAQGAAALAQPGKTVVVLCGSVHADQSVGIALHLPPHMRCFSLLLRGLGENPDPALPAGFDAMWLTPGTPPRDHCAELRRQLQRR